MPGEVQPCDWQCLVCPARVPECVPGGGRAGASGPPPGRLRRPVLTFATLPRGGKEVSSEDACP